MESLEDLIPHSTGGSTLPQILLWLLGAMPVKESREGGWEGGN